MSADYSCWIFLKSTRGLLLRRVEWNKFHAILTVETAALVLYASEDRTTSLHEFRVGGCRIFYPAVSSETRHLCLRLHLLNPDSHTIVGSGEGGGDSARRVKKKKRRDEVVVLSFEKAADLDTLEYLLETACRGVFCGTFVDDSSLSRRRRRVGPGQRGKRRGGSGGGEEADSDVVPPYVVSRQQEFEEFLLSIGVEPREEMSAFEQLIRLATEDVSVWDVNDGQTWLALLGLRSVHGDRFLSERVDGRKIEKMKMESLVGGESRMNELAEHVEKIQRERCIRLGEIAVRHKLSAGFGSDEFVDEDVVQALSDVGALKHQFLNSTRQIPLQDEANWPLGQSPSLLSDRVIVKLLLRVTFCADKIRGPRCALSPYTPPALPDPRPRPRNDDGFVTKVFLRPNEPNLDPSDAPKFRTCLVVGPWLLQWSDLGLCVPKRKVGMFLGEGAELGRVGGDEVGRLQQILAEIIVRWNTSYGFLGASEREAEDAEQDEDLSVTAQVSSVNRNCQMFVDELIDALAIPSFPPSSPLRRFCRSVRRNGREGFKYHPSPAFRENFGILETEIVFSDHIVLDRFCLGIREACLDVFERFGQDWELLKAFDRAFWLYHLAALGEDDRFIPYLDEHVRTSKPEPTSCPFVDPRAVA